MITKKEHEATVTYWEQELAIAKTGHRKHVCQTVLNVLRKLGEK